MAQWMVDGVPDVDITGIDIARMAPFQNTPKYLKDRTVEILGVLFEEAFPNKHFKTARNVRKSAFHDRLAAAGAYFGEYAGWEYPDWFAPKGVEPKVEYSWGRQNWFELQCCGTPRGSRKCSHVGLLGHGQNPGTGARCGKIPQPYLR